MVKVGQEFKNYKELCLYLNEDVKAGRGKELQLKRWQLSFSWHTEGHKIVIDAVNRDYVRRSMGGNRKHLDTCLPYIIFCLKTSGMKDSYVGTQRMLRSELKLVSTEIYDVYNHRGQEHTEYLARQGISSYDSFLKFTHSFEVQACETLERCLKTLAREGGVYWEPGQIFVVGTSHRRRVYTTEYGDVLDLIEEAVCNEMNTGDELKGRQYLHVIKRDPELMKTFYDECLRRLMQDKELTECLRRKYEGKYNDEFSPEMVIKYFRLYYIERIDNDVLRKWKLPDKVDDLRLKKAFVNPVGQEMQMLRKKVYEDIFQRMASKSKKTNNKLGIPDNDFEKLKTLFENSQTPVTRNYNAPKKKKQEIPELEDMQLLEN